MLIHASCAARDGQGVLLLGPPGSGKSDLLLRLLDFGFTLVADDQVEVEDGLARPPPELAGLLEVRGLGIFRIDYTERVPLALAVTLARSGERLPEASHGNIPSVIIDPVLASAPARVCIALDCVLGRCSQVAGVLQ